MKHILLIYLISILFLNLISCTIKKNDSDKNILFFRESYGEMGWHSKGNKDKDGTYVGEIKKNKPHGQGTYTYYNTQKSSINQLSLLIPGMPKIIVFVITLWQMLNQGKEEGLPDRYVGNWNRGEKNGEGTYFFPNGDMYIGKWSNGKQHGEGTYLFSNKDKYEGKWKHGKQHGEGTYFFRKGDTFAGKWKNGLAHGNGIYTYPDGEKFIGAWNYGIKKTQGVLIFSD